MEDKCKRGFVFLSRDVFDSNLWQLPPDHFRVAVYLLSKARHKTKPHILPDGLKIGRGELVTSMALIAENCSYYENRMVREMSRKKALNILETLEKIGFLKRNSHSKGTHIIICNYGLYQDADNYKSHIDETVKEHRGNSEGTVRDTNKKGNNVEEGEKGEELFCPEPQSDSAPEDIVLTFDCTGPKKQWHLTKDKLEQYKATFDTIDVDKEARKAWQWLVDNRQRRKTHNGMPGFLGRWFAKSANSWQATSKQFDQPKLIL